MKSIIDKCMLETDPYIIDSADIEVGDCISYNIPNCDNYTVLHKGSIYLLLMDNKTYDFRYGILGEKYTIYHTGRKMVTDDLVIRAKDFALNNWGPSVISALNL